MPFPAIACHNKPLREKAVVLCIAAAVHLGSAGMANARLITEELMLPIAHFGTAVSAGAASSAMTDHCQEIYDEFRGTAVFIDYEIDTTSTYTFVEIAVAGEVIKMTAHPIKAHYKFFSNKLPDHLSSLGAQAVIFRINSKFKQPSVEIRFSSNNRYECHLIASVPK
ncbi:MULTISPECIES: hypothetical protein [unclassified Pseudovibrio]|uniref:hypothetical protein n=1 Tax=unclassified Pseudovibrio TaxID=2627060 RepID=UPI0007AEA612|nr:MULTISPECIES: hypothetical protein [unclassified Pseudovibrio]KZL14806.1 hypothetical protein PsAD37_04923 [Pseudovibrio sp. Ad37]KZL22491.1 hypothetical protein PsWM33_03841 [Pseudovibrio sp. WM33]